MRIHALLTTLLPLGALLCPLTAGDLSIQTSSDPYPEFGEIERIEIELDDLIAPGTSMVKLAEGFDWAEGPVWIPDTGKLYFSDVPANIVYQWKDGHEVSIFLSPSGFTGAFYDGREPGSNGLLLDAQGRLVLCQHGDRRVARLNDGRRGFTTLAGSYNGKRLNSPNDACYDSQGNLYFTDPPYGMGPSTKRELDIHGVYRVSPEGEVTLLSDELERPNGIALSPDEKTLYVSNSHGPRPIIMAFPVRADFTLGEGSVFFDSSELHEKGRPGGTDGLKTDVEGNVWATAPGGVVILDAQGKLLGSLLTGRRTANVAFGGADGKTLFITADDTLCRIVTNVSGYFPTFE